MGKGGCISQSCDSAIWRGLWHETQNVLYFCIKSNSNMINELWKKKASQRKILKSGWDPQKFSQCTVSLKIQVKKTKEKKKQKPVKWIDLYNKLLLSLAGTHISYTHGKFSSCIQGTFLFSTLHSNQVDFSSMAACSDESWIWWKCYGPGIHCKDQQCFAVSTSVKCFHPLTSRLITLSCSPWT